MQPGQVVSVDQLESTTPGFVAQLKGILTTQQYKYATILVNQFSKLSFEYLQKKITSAETVMAKQAFEYLQETLVSKFCTTMWTTAALLTMDLFKAVNKTTKASLTAVSMHTSKMEWQKNTLGICRNRPGQCSSLPSTSGWTCCPRPYGLMHCAQPMKCAMPLCFQIRKQHQLNNLLK